MTAVADRREKCRRLAAEPFDVLVIGGGINGAGIAREAALRGLRTALVDKGDFASGTSSRSSKLIHGGVRYLEHGEVGLVLEASRERDLLRRRLATHLVRPLPFFFPVYRGGPVALWKLGAGLLAYDVLAGFRNIRRHRLYGAGRALSLEPSLRAEGLRGGALYYDCMTDDSRLVLETILAAGSAGAVCVNYVALERFVKSSGTIEGVRLRDLDGGEGVFTASARIVVNATGPWLDRVRALDEPTATPILRLTKGVHVVVPRELVGNRHAVVLHAVSDRRVLFVIPWGAEAIVGTTDTDFEGAPEEVEAEAEDVDYLLATVNFHFPEARLLPSDVISTFAGLRPLVAGPALALPSAVSREEAISESASGLVSIGGGKLTTYRRVAIKVVDHVAAALADRHGIRAAKASGTDRLPLPGAVDFVPPESGEEEGSVALRYGSRASELLEAVRLSPELGCRLDPHTGHLRVEAWYAARSEMACRVEDVLRRRTTLALRSADGGAAVAELTAMLMSEPAGWDAATVHRRAEEYRDLVAGSRKEPQRRKA